MKIEDYERLLPHMTVEWGEKKVVYAVQNTLTQGRVNTLFTKEPDTIEWLNAMKPGEVLFDIGANVGMYTLWASVMNGVKVFAFEPESQNYAILNRNIVINKSDARAYCLALSDDDAVDMLYLSGFIPGGSCHNFGEQKDYKYQPTSGRLAQGCLCSTVDAMVSWLRKPDHIKLDVDGIEPKVLRGAMQTLPHIKSLLVELNSNLEDHREVLKTMESLNFKWSPEQVEKSQRKEGAFKGVGNVIFYHD